MNDLNLITRKKVFDTLDQLNNLYGRGKLHSIHWSNPFRQGLHVFDRIIPTSQSHGYIESRFFRITVNPGKITVRAMGHQKTFVI